MAFKLVNSRIINRVTKHYVIGWGGCSKSMCGGGGSHPSSSPGWLRIRVNKIQREKWCFLVRWPRSGRDILGDERPGEFLKIIKYNSAYNVKCYITSCARIISYNVFFVFFFSKTKHNNNFRITNDVSLSTW